MASDTATLDLERIHAAARRAEAKRVELGPEDRAPEDTGPIETDPATRAHLIVQEVLAAAAKGPEAEVPRPEIPVETDSDAAAQARRIVEEVLAAAEAASPYRQDGTESDRQEAAEILRTDLVMLGLEQPMALIPGTPYQPTPAAFAPPARRPLSELIEDTLAPLLAESTATAPQTFTARGTYVEPDDTVPSQRLREAVEKAASSERMHGTRWIIAGAVWAVAFAVAVPVLINGIMSSVDMTVDLWGDAETPVAEASVEGETAAE